MSKRAPAGSTTATLPEVLNCTGWGKRAAPASWGRDRSGKQLRGAKSRAPLLQGVLW